MNINPDMVYFALIVSLSVFGFQLILVSIANSEETVNPRINQLLTIARIFLNFTLGVAMALIGELHRRDTQLGMAKLFYVLGGLNLISFIKSYKKLLLNKQ